MPQGDFRIGLDVMEDENPTRCPRRITPETELKKLSAEDLRRCRNLPYALHGMPFKSTDLRAYFYRPATVEEGENVIRLQENPAYADSLLTPEDVAYVKAVQRELEARKAEGAH